MGVQADMVAIGESVPPIAKLISILHDPCHRMISILF
jgi:hypothetical protein